MRPPGDRYTESLRGGLRAHVGTPSPPPSPIFPCLGCGAPIDRRSRGYFGSSLCLSCQPSVYGRLS